MILDIFELVKEDEPIKIENTDEHVSEYVLEEFIDEDTNDGFESEHGMIQDDDLESAEQTLKSIEICKKAL